MLNFSLGGFGPACKIASLERQALNLDVDGMIYVVIDDYRWIPIELAKALTDKNEDFYFYGIRELAQKAGITETTSKKEVEIRLRDHLQEAATWYYTYLQNLAADHGVDLWFAFIPVPEDQSKVEDEIAEQKALAHSLGIETFDIRDTYSPLENMSDVWIAPWDTHPNAAGQQMLADRMYDEFFPLLSARLARNDVE